MPHQGTRYSTVSWGLLGPDGEMRILGSEEQKKLDEKNDENTLPETNIHPQRLNMEHVLMEAWKIIFIYIYIFFFSFLNGWIVGFMLIFQGVAPENRLGIPTRTFQERAVSFREGIHDINRLLNDVT